MCSDLGNDLVSLNLEHDHSFSTNLAGPLVRAAARSCYAKLGRWVAERPAGLGVG